MTESADEEKIKKGGGNQRGRGHGSDSFAIGKKEHEVC